MLFRSVTAHPEGCAAHVQEWINHVKAAGPVTQGPRKVLVIGSSTGYGLASRIAATFGSGAATIGVAAWAAPDSSNAHIRWTARIYRSLRADPACAAVCCPCPRSDV